MDRHVTNILITGPPRCGKTTLIERIVARISRPATGFFTRQVVEHGTRTGFKIVTLDHQEGLLAHERVKGDFSVGKYGVSLRDLESIAVPAMAPSSPDQIIVIDEIGKMECLSELFRETLVRTLAARNRVIGSVALKGDPFIGRIKARPDVEVIRVTEANRDALVPVLLRRLTEE